MERLPKGGLADGCLELQECLIWICAGFSPSRPGWNSCPTVPRHSPCRPCSASSSSEALAERWLLAVILSSLVNSLGSVMMGHRVMALLYHTGLQTHPWGGVHSSVTGRSEAGYKTACNVIVKRFPWVVLSRNLSCLFSSKGSVTKKTSSRKTFFETEGSVYCVNFRESYLGEGRK